MRVIRTLEELDAELAEVEAAGRVSDAARRARFAAFCMEPPASLPADPFGADYAAAQMALYEAIAGRAHGPDAEATPINVEAALRNPFPWSQRNPRLAGEITMITGNLLRRLDLAPGARVLELGAGWGNTALPLARLGLKVTALDIEPRFCELLRRRALAEGTATRIEVVHADFLWTETAPRASFDAAIFVACFHHAFEHLRLLRALRRLVRPGGRLFLAREPIAADFPMPWGVRLDGQSLWAIRRRGWMELGFRDDYFRRALLRAGWQGQVDRPAGLDFLALWEATPLPEGFALPATDPRIRLQAGRRDAAGIAAEGEAGCVCYGPYLPITPGRWRVRMRFTPGCGLRGHAVADACAGAGGRILAQAAIAAAALDPAQPEIAFGFALEEGVEDLEIRLHAQPGFTAHLAAIAVEPNAPMAA